MEYLRPDKVHDHRFLCSVPRYLLYQYRVWVDDPLSNMSRFEVDPIFI